MVLYSCLISIDRPLSDRACRSRAEVLHPADILPRLKDRFALLKRRRPPAALRVIRRYGRRWIGVMNCSTVPSSDYPACWLYLPAASTWQRPTRWVVRTRSTCSTASSTSRWCWPTRQNTAPATGCWRRCIAMRGTGCGNHVPQSVAGLARGMAPLNGVAGPLARGTMAPRAEDRVMGSAEPSTTRGSAASR
jgi:hypothetical protein